jgi:hypothetical protein
MSEKWGWNGLPDDHRSAASEAIQIHAVKPLTAKSVFVWRERPARVLPRPSANVFKSEIKREPSASRTQIVN